MATNRFGQQDKVSDAKEILTLISHDLRGNTGTGSQHNPVTLSACVANMFDINTAQVLTVDSLTDVGDLFTINAASGLERLPVGGVGEFIGSDGANPVYTTLAASDLPAHAGTHENAGGDQLSVAGLSGELADAQPVAVSKNSGAIVGTRSELNFVEGANITLAIADDAGNDEVDITIATSGLVAAHTILDGSVHTDSAADGVTRGSLIAGNSTPLWDELVHPGGAGYALTTDANDVMWDQTPAWTGEHSFAAGITFNGASDANELTIPNNLAIGFELEDAGGLEYLRIVSTDAQPVINFNSAAADVDFHVEASGVTDALQVRGSDGQITLGVLGTGVVQSDVGGALSSGAILLTNLDSYAEGALIIGGAVDWETLLEPGGAGFALVSDGATFAWDQTPAWAGEHVFGAGLEISDDQDLTFGDGNDTTMRYDEAGDNRLEISGADWHFAIDEMTLLSATSAKPVLAIENTNADALAPVLEFYKNTASPADNDDLGAIDFYGKTSTGAKERYAYIFAESLDVTNGDTGGGLDLRVVMDAAERSMIEINGYNGSVNEGEVIVNQDGQDVDFRIEGDNYTHLIFTQASNDRVGINMSAPDAQLSIDQSGAALAIPVLKLDQADVSEPCILYSVSGADADIVLWELDVTGTPALTWDESEDAQWFSHALAVRATLANAEGLYVPWITGDALTTAYFGSANINNNRDAVTGVSYSANGIKGVTTTGAGAGVRGDGGALGAGVVGVSIPNIGVYGVSSSSHGVHAESATGVGLVTDLTGVGTIADFRDNGASVLTIQDGGQADFAEYIRHLGDTDTFWRFQLDQATLDCGGVTFLNAVEAGTDYLQLLDGLNIVGDTSNANMSVGLTLRQGANDDEIFNCGSSDVAAVWASVETGTWASFTKSEGAAGGLDIRGFKDDDGSVAGAALKLEGFFADDASTVKTTAARAIVELIGFQTDGSALENTVADGNTVAILTRRGGGTVTTHWFDEDGDFGYNGALVSYDHLDDAGMARDLQRVLTKREGVHYNIDAMVKAGILHPSENGIMVSHKRMTALQLGAHAQAYDDRRQLEARIEYLEKQLRKVQ